jgi:hypothetical protein
VQINQGKDLIVFTTNPAQDQVQKVKIRNTQGQLTELERVTGLPNAYSLAGYPVGVYVLDVIVQLSNSNRQGAYETTLVIIPPKQQPQPINFAVILQTIKTVIDTDIRIIDDDGRDDGKRCPPPDPCQDNPNLPQCQPPPPESCPEGTTGTRSDCVPIPPPPDPCIENPNAEECQEPIPEPEPEPVTPEEGGDEEGGDGGNEGEDGGDGGDGNGGGSEDGGGGGEEEGG